MLMKAQAGVVTPDIAYLAVAVVAFLNSGGIFVFSWMGRVISQWSF